MNTMNQGQFYRRLILHPKNPEFRLPTLSEVCCTYCTRFSYNANETWTTVLPWFKRN